MNNKEFELVSDWDNNIHWIIPLRKEKPIKLIAPTNYIIHSTEGPYILEIETPLSSLNREQLLDFLEKSVII